jgi:phage-related protein
LGNLGGVGNVVSNVVGGVGNALGSVGNAIGKVFSDIRMKENIKHTHWLPNGLPVYTYEYKPEFKDLAGHGKHIGVMAQEVAQVIPEAVSVQENGYMMVDYSKVL